MRGGGKKRESGDATERRFLKRGRRPRPRHVRALAKQFKIAASFPWKCSFHDFVTGLSAAEFGGGAADGRDERSGRGPFLTQMETILFPREKMKRDYFLDFPRA